jgi:hypothetical protein
VITVELARRLADAGLAWHPQSGDRFVIADREMDSQVFVVSEMVVEAEVLSSGGVLKFNGTTEWALDSVDQEGTLWLPREDQLRAALGDAFVRLERTDLGWAVTTTGPHGPTVSEHADPEDAYADALLGLLAAA